MEILELSLAALGLLIMLGVGTVAHEFTHAIVLRALDVPYDIEWFSARNTTTFFNASTLGTWATVTPRSIPRETPAWGLRLSAIAPLLLATPILLVFVGILPDPLQMDSALAIALTVAWLGCAIPSPQDFSLFWYADQVIDDHADG